MKGRESDRQGLLDRIQTPSLHTHNTCGTCASSTQLSLIAAGSLCSRRGRSAAGSWSGASVSSSRRSRGTARASRVSLAPRERPARDNTGRGEMSACSRGQKRGLRGWGKETAVWCGVVWCGY
jgi:hypothetical protein